MKKVFILLLVCSSAFAQEQRPSDTEINARVQAFADLDASAQAIIKQQAAAKIGALTDALDKAQKELAAAKAQCAAPAKP